MVQKKLDILQDTPPPEAGSRNDHSQNFDQFFIKFNHFSAKNLTQI
jgi:hypothetical protein